MRITIIAITMLAFVNMITGCAYTDQQSRIDEQNPIPAKKILAVVLTTTLDGFVRTDGDSVLFQENSGVYDKDARIISGKLEDGNEVSASVDDLEWIRLTQETLEGRKLRLVDRTIFLSHAVQTPWHIRGGHSVQAGILISFKEFGASYEYTSRIITGVTDDGKRVEIDADKVHSVETKEFSAGRLLLSTALIGAAVYVATAFLITIEFINSFKAD